MKIILVLISICALAQADVIRNGKEYKSPLEQPKYQKILEKLNPEGFDKRGGRITGGMLAVMGQFPYQTLNFLDDSYICGGSIISEDWVLTAGHCVYGFSFFEVNAGVIYAGNYGVWYDFVTDSSSIIVHANYDDDTLANDIALLKMPRAITFGDYVGPIAISPRAHVGTSFEHYIATVSGFGLASDSTQYIDYLRFVQSPIGSNDWCAQYFGQFVLETNICMRTDNGKSSCSGDSGSPMTMSVNDEFFVLGIVSYGAAAGCELGYPAVFTRVTSYIDWIENYTGLQID